jgi:hypothetical protein
MPQSSETLLIYFKTCQIYETPPTERTKKQYACLVRTAGWKAYVIVFILREEQPGGVWEHGAEENIWTCEEGCGVLQEKTA